MPTPGLLTPARVVELRGQTFSGGVPVRKWLFRGFDTALDVDVRLQQFTAGEVPLFWGGLPIDLAGRSITELGGGEWEVSIPYSARTGPIIEPGAGATQKAPGHGGNEGRNESVLFNISYHVAGTTQTVKQSIRTIQQRATNDRPARNFGRAIGVDTDTWEVTGCEVVTGEPGFEVAVKIPNQAFTGSYANAMANLLRHPVHRRACVNKAKFFGFEAGEVLIKDGFVGELEADGMRQGRFAFAVSRNVEELVICDVPELKLPNVKGWSYVWTTYEVKSQNTGVANPELPGENQFRTATMPFEVYEEEVYPEGDFSALGLEFYAVPAP